jgi:hypothetical protein
MKTILALIAIFVLLCACEPMAAQESSATAETEQADVMDQPLDGSSIESFEAGLQRIREVKGEPDYQRVQAAIGWLMVYDLAARRNKETLYKRLDGLTPKQVIERAEVN